MDSSAAVLRQQSQNKIRRDFQRMKNEYNKIPPHQKSSKLLSASHPSNQHCESKDPGNSEMGRKTPVKPGISRLPVPVKSLCLQTPCDFSQSHCKWEEKPLAGKAKKKKPCTRLLPFNLSQPKSLRTANENQLPIAISQPKTGIRAVQPDNSVCNARLKPPKTYVKHTKHPATSGSNMASNSGTRTTNGQATETRSQLKGQSGPCDTLKTSATLSHPLSSVPNSALHQSSVTSAQNVLNAEACLENMNLLSLKDPTKASHASQNMQPTMGGNSSKISNDKRVNFQFDHAALLSILRNEGVSATDLGSATPQSKPYNNLPMRVSVMKIKQKAGPTTGSITSIQFSPDAAARQSILQNEGVKGVGLVAATPRHSVCPSVRSTSIYSAQRVPVRKNLAEPTRGPVAVEPKESPLQKWTPQRIRNTSHQPMSAMRWHLSTQQSPYPGTPGPQRCKTSHQKDIVQRLFDDQGDEPAKNVTEKDPETQKEQHSAQSKTTKSLSEEKVETSASSDEEKEQRVAGLQPFIQAPERESVIFFSTGKKMLRRGPRFEQQESSSNHERQCPVPSEQRTVLPTHKETSAVSQPTCQINPSFQSLHGGLTAQKTCALSSAVLRKRFPPLEELRMDEEVATYTSVFVSAAPGFLPPRPRCGNPLASTMYFEESTRFVPVGLDLSSGSSSPLSSPLKER